MDMAAFDPKMMFDHPDPYPFFAMLRQSQPVFRAEFMNRVAYIVSKYDDCLAILKDSETFSSKSNALVGTVMGRTLIEMDGKEHTRHRALVQQAFVPKNLDAVEPVVRAIVDRLADDIGRSQKADFVGEFTERFPIQVMAHLLDIPRADYPQFQKWAIAIIGFPKDLAGGLEAAAAVREYLLPIIRERRAKPGDDLITRLITGRVDGRGLDDEEVVNFCRLLLPAGAETTMRLIGNMMVALLTDRSRYERVRDDRTQIGWATEETLRWETSVLMVSRAAMKPVTIQGVDIPEDAMLSVLLASGNRDEDHYDQPDVWDLDRHADDHLSFAFGRHHCLGYHLARMEARIALEGIFDRLPHLALDPAAGPPQILGMAFRSPQVLRVLPNG